MTNATVSAELKEHIARLSDPSMVWVKEIPITSLRSCAVEWNDEFAIHGELSDEALHILANFISPKYLGIPRPTPREYVEFVHKNSSTHKCDSIESCQLHYNLMLDYTEYDLDYEIVTHWNDYDKPECAQSKQDVIDLLTEVVESLDENSEN